LGTGEANDKGRRTQTAVALEVHEKGQKSAEREQDRQEWLQREREQAFKRNPRLLH
jgi:hypothetical protein